jgi:hypothetical protein
LYRQELSDKQGINEPSANELSVNELTQVSGASIGTATLLWFVLVEGQEMLNDFGEGLGRGLYDGIHQKEDV